MKAVTWKFNTVDGVVTVNLDENDGVVRIFTPNDGAWEIALGDDLSEMIAALHAAKCESM